MTETRELRRVRLLDMRHNQKMTLGAIAKIEQVTSSRIGQLIGNTGRINLTASRLMEVYRFIESYNARRRSPTLGEIAIHFPNKKGIPTSSSVVRYWLDRLEEKEMIEPREPRLARSLFVLPLDRRNSVIREMLRIEKENEKK